jgi:tRNA 5-methylaminomethyl-2-thiouridine biosynthesis bifunctional protein
MPFSSLPDSQNTGADAARYLMPHALPSRWADRRGFTLLDTDFGDGRGFLATWAAWRADPVRCERLNFVALWAPDAWNRPVSADYPVLSEALAAALSGPLAMRVPGVHRLAFEEGRVALTLALGEPAQMLQKLWLRADAFNVQPASAFDARATCKALARLAGEHATVRADWRSDLHPDLHPDWPRAFQDAGFVCDEPVGTTLLARFAPRWRVRRHEPPVPFDVPERRAIVIGAGLAGCAVTSSLAARGWHVTLIDRREDVARDASGNPAGVFHPIVWRDDSIAARLTRAGFLQSLQHWRALEVAGHDLRRSRSGLLQIADTPEDADAMAHAIRRFGFPASFVIAATEHGASRLAGVAVARGGWFFPLGGWISPAAICAAQSALAEPVLTRRFNTEVARIERDGQAWRAIDAHGGEIARAPVLVLANAGDAQRLGHLDGHPTRGVRGQLTLLEGVDALETLRVPVIGDGYAVPLAPHLTLTGATYDIDSTDLEVRAEGHTENLERLARMLPSVDSVAVAPVNGRVAFRCVTSDRMPMIGALADQSAARANAAQLSGAWPLDLPRAAGLFGAFAFGSRGLVWSVLGAELIAAQIEGEPWPLERELAEAIDPARFLLRALRSKSLV